MTADAVRPVRTVRLAVMNLFCLLESPKETKKM